MSMVLGIVLFLAALRFLHGLGFAPHWTLGGALVVALVGTSMIESFFTAALQSLASAPILLFLAVIAAVGVGIALWMAHEGLINRDSFDPF